MSQMRLKNHGRNKEFTYRLDGKIITEPHFNFQPTLAAYNAYRKKIPLDDALDKRLVLLYKLWSGENNNNSVGMHQRFWSAWMLQLIGGPRDF